MLGLLVGTILQLVFPFLTQSLVDIGIETQNLNFIHLILIGQLVLIFSQIVVKFLQSWILLHITSQCNHGGRFSHKDDEVTLVLF